MSERFLKFIPSTDTIQFAIKYKNAFVLLMIIAERARRTNGGTDGLKAGQCHLGNHKDYGMTEKEYRYAKEVLVKKGLIKIIVTNRTRKKIPKKKAPILEEFGAAVGATVRATVRATDGATENTTLGATELTTNGTLVQLCNSEVWDINSEDDNQHKGDRNFQERATDGAEEGRLLGRSKGDKQERERKNKKEEEEKDIAQPASRPRSKSDGLSFDFEKWEYIGITEKDMQDWKTIYPEIDLKIEITKSIGWLKANPSKSNKTLWRKFLTGWLQRANESASNKKAFKAASGSPGADRRTKDIDGNPVENQHKGKF